jgi:hypothetical protein
VMALQAEGVNLSPRQIYGGGGLGLQVLSRRACDRG